MFDTVCFFSKPGPITQEQLSTFLGIAEFPLPVICFIYMDYITDRIFRRKKRKKTQSYSFSKTKGDQNELG